MKSAIAVGAGYLLLCLAGSAVAQPPPPVDEAAVRAAIEADQKSAAAVQPVTGTEISTPQPPLRAAGSSVLNPNMSVIVDGDFGYYGLHGGDFEKVGIPVSGDDPSPEKEGFTLQEVELAFQAAIDPYLEGSVFLTIPNLEGIEVEEAYLLTTDLPANLQIKAGTFRSQVGRNNTQHLHLQNFTRRPLMTPLLFGADGLRAPGAQVSLLVPKLPWFATLYLEALSVGPPEEAGVATFGGGGPRGPRRLTYTAVLEQFWAVSDATSLALGLNGATGLASECAMPPCADSRRSYLYGADLYFKWRPPNVVGEGHSVSWSTEYFARTVAHGPTEAALYTEPVVQLAKRWYLGARLDVTGIPEGTNIPRRYGTAGSVTFAPTEFSRIRLYGQELWGPGAPATMVGFLQVEFSMGAHGAHPF